MPGRRTFDLRGKGLQQLLCPVTVASVARQFGEANKVPHSQAVARGDHRVIRILGPGEQFFMPLRGQEEPASLIDTLFDHLFRQPHRLFEPALIFGRMVQSQQAANQCGVIFQVGRHLGLATSRNMQQQSIARSNFLQNKVRRSFGGIGVIASLKGLARFSKRLNRQSVPPDQNLIVLQ